MTSETHIPYDELPLWMRQAKQEFDWGILIIIAMSLAIGWTFLITSDLPAGHQLEHYIFQASDISTGFQEGVFYPRWSPYALKGYGAPIPNYYPMGTAYTIAIVSALFTNDIFQATRLVFVLAYVLAGLGVYLYLSRRTDSAIGLFGSVLYLFSPMIGSTIPFVMGDLSLLIASGLLPLTMWTSYRLTTVYGVADLIMHTILVGLLIWIHPQMAIFSISITTVLTLIEHAEISRFRRIFRSLLGNLTGIFLVSFFWIPALFERDLVQWQAIEPTQQLNLSFAQLFAPMQQIDSGLLIPQPQFKIGWILLLFFILGLISIVRYKPIRTVNIFLVILIMIVIALGIGIFPSEVWLLSPVTLFIALVAAQTLAFRRFLTPVGRRFLLTASIAATVIFAQPIWLIPPYNLTIDSIDAVSQIRFEQQGFGIPTLAKGANLPSTLDPDTPTNRALVNSYTIDSPQRYEDRQNNANTILGLISTQSHQQVYRIFNRYPTELEFVLPYFDGWQAYVDGTPIPTFANPANNMVTISAPVVSEGELVITLNSTPIRSLAWFISLSILGILIMVSFVRRRNTTQTPDVLIETLPRTDIRLLLVMFVSLGVVIIIFASETSPIQLQTQPTYTLAQSLPLQSRTNAGLEASTFTINQTVAYINDTIELTIYWKALTSIVNNHKSRVRLRSIDNGVIWYEGELQPMGRTPTRRWIRNLFVSDQHKIVIPYDIFAGEYEAVIDVFPCQLECDLSSPLTFFNLSGEQIGQQLVIPISITIQ